MKSPMQGPRAASGPGLQLLLARAGDHKPVLEEGLAVESAREAPRPKALPGRVEVPQWQRADVDPNVLAAQRWGVIAPEGQLMGSLWPRSTTGSSVPSAFHTRAVSSQEVVTMR